MPQYIDTPIETNPDVLAQMVFEYLQDNVPGYIPNAGNLDVILAEGMARISAEVRDVASRVPTSIFRYYGNSILGIIPIDEAPASVDTTWTLINNSGYTIQAGTFVGMRRAGDVLIPFEVVNEVIVPPGFDATAAGAVTIVAVEPGDEGNGLSGSVELIDTLDWVKSITTSGNVTSGGVDAEDDAVYLDRLATQMTLLSPRPIIPRDFALLAQNVAGVDRALALDGYNPAGQTFNNERMVAVALIDEAGNAVSSAVKQNVDTLLQAEREVNFIVHVIDPNYATVNITFQAKVLPGYDPVGTAEVAVQAVSNYLNPADWGQPPVGDQREWRNVTSVRYLEVAQVINSVQGIDYIIQLRLALAGQTLGVDDVVLPGVAPLPIAGSISGVGIS